MKRILVGLCAVMMLIGMAACQREPQSASSSGTEISSQTSLPDTSAATETASTLSQTESAGESTASSVSKATSRTKAPVTTTSKAPTTTTTKAASQEPSLYPATPRYTPEESAQLITNKNAKNMGKLPSDRVLIADFDPDWAYCHHASLAYFKGKLYASWSQGRTNEDDLGQRVMLSVSSNFSDWSDPVPIVDSMMGLYSETVLTSQRFYCNGDTLYLYFSKLEYTYESLQENHTLRPLDKDGYGVADALYNTAYAIYTTDGVNWSEPQELAVGGGVQAPIKTAGGREIFFTGQGVLYNDDKNGLAWLPFSIDRSYVNDAIKRGANILTEGCGYETDDYVLHLLMRSNAGYLWQSESYDNGKTWSKVYKTNFAVDASMSNSGRLPDGRYYIICNPVFNWKRTPLSIFVSEDGYNFDKQYIIRDETDYTMQQDGLYKGGAFAYPEAIIQGDYLYVLYSKEKEVMEITRIAIQDIK